MRAASGRSRLAAAGARLPAPLRRWLRRLPGVHRLRNRLTGRPALPRPAAGTLRPVVYLPTWARWDAMRQRPQYLLEAFARHGHEVYFVDPREPGPRAAGDVRVVATLAEVPAAGVILYVHFAPVREMFHLFEDAVVIYDILDDLSIYDPDEVDLPAERRVRAHHPPVMSAADVVIVSNPLLAERHGHERPDLLVVENGVDPDRFSAPVEPAREVTEFAAGRPVIGYHGALAAWFDFGLLAAVAEAEPGLAFALVGPAVDASGKRAARDLSDIANVAVFGERASDAMPAYVQSFDVGTIWFEISEMTSAVTPLKMYEYLAAGRPCVSTPLPAAVAAPLVLTAATVDEFRQSLHRALGQRTDPGFLDAAVRAAEAASWSVRVQPVLDRLEAAGRLRT